MKQISRAIQKIDAAVLKIAELEIDDVNVNPLLVSAISSLNAASWLIERELKGREYLKKIERKAEKRAEKKAAEGSEAPPTEYLDFTELDGFAVGDEVETKKGNRGTITGFVNKRIFGQTVVCAEIAFPDETKTYGRLAKLVNLTPHPVVEEQAPKKRPRKKAA